MLHIENIISLFHRQKQIYKNRIESKIESKSDKKDISKFFSKEIFDRIGYGFGSQDFINMLFARIGASNALVAMVNGIKPIISSIFGFFIAEYISKYAPKKVFAYLSGILYGFSFLILALAAILRSKMLFVVTLILGSIAIFVYGIASTAMLVERVSSKELGAVSGKIGSLGIVLITLSILFGGAIISVFGNAGFSVAFMITAIAFIFSGYILLTFNEVVHPATGKPFVEMAATLWQSGAKHVKQFFSNRVLQTILIAQILSTFVQTLTNSFYAIYMDRYLGIGSQVGLFYAIAIGVSFFAPYMAGKLSDNIGRTVVISVCYILAGFLPLGFYLFDSFVPLVIFGCFGMIGFMVVNGLQNIYLAEQVPKEDLTAIYATIGVLTTLPLLVLQPLGIWLINVVGLKAMFMFSALFLMFAVAPLYLFLYLRIIKNENRLKAD